VLASFGLLVFSLTTAETALLISIVATGIALTGLVWQLALYKLSGARIEVRLIPGVVTETGNLLRGDPSGWKRSMPESMNIVLDRPWVDVTLIQVINIGRAPVSVSEIGLDFGPEPRWKPWSRYVMTSRPIAIHQGNTAEQQLRLEAGQAATTIIDCWPLINHAKGPKSGVSVRGTVLPAGRRRKRSPWRRRWKIGANHRALWPHGPESDEVSLFQAVWRNVAPVAPQDVYGAWISISQIARDAQNQGSLRQSGTPSARQLCIK